MDENELNEPSFIHTHIVAALTSTCVLLMAMLVM